MSRGGQAKNRQDPERTCIVTRQAQPAEGMVRFVVSPDGMVVPDVLGKLPGRGMWVTATRDALDQAGKGQFARAAKAQVTVPDGLADLVEEQLTKRVIELIALARKSGQAVCGFEKVKGWLSSGPRLRVLLQASDGSTRGKSKLWTPEGARYFDCLTGSELGLAFGRETAIHGVVAAGGLGDRVVEDAIKLRGLRGTNGGDRAPGKDDS